MKTYPLETKSVENLCHAYYTIESTLRGRVVSGIRIHRRQHKIGFITKVIFDGRFVLL